MIITHDLTCNLRNSLKIIFPEKPTEKFTCAEIGCFEGVGSVLIQNYLCNHGESRLICIDPWDDVHCKKGDKRMSFWDHACRGQAARFKANTKDYDKIVPMQGYSDEVIPKLEDESLDFVYVDGDHSPQQVYVDAVNIFPKMKSGSVILFDDYLWNMHGMVTKEGIDKFLTEYASKCTIILNAYQLAVRVN